MLIDIKHVFGHLDNANDILNFGLNCSKLNFLDRGHRSQGALALMPPDFDEIALISIESALFPYET